MSTVDEITNNIFESANRFADEVANVSVDGFVSGYRAVSGFDPPAERVESFKSGLRTSSRSSYLTGAVEALRLLIGNMEPEPDFESDLPDGEGHRPYLKSAVEAVEAEVARLRSEAKEEGKEEYLVEYGS